MKGERMNHFLLNIKDEINSGKSISKLYKTMIIFGINFVILVQK